MCASVAAAVCTALPHRASAQAAPSARRDLVIQAGGDLALAHSGSDPSRMAGYGVYIDADGPGHFGIELALHQLNAPHSIVYERTYEMGLRYHGHWRSAEPYAEALYGRGVFNFPAYAAPADPLQARANLAYNLAALGGGVDLPLNARVALRAGVTWQQWFPGSYPTAPLPGSPDCPFLCHGMRPARFTLGAAFRVPAGRVRRK